MQKVSFKTAFAQGSLSPERRDFFLTSHLVLSFQSSLILCIVSGFGSLYLFQSPAGGIFGLIFE